MIKKNKEIIIQNWGLQSFNEAWCKQEMVLQSIIDVKKINRRDRVNKKTSNYLIFLEHNPVYTLGKSGDINNLLIDYSVLNKNNIEFVRTNRGGDITFHGPGQLVVYPIFDLDNFFTDIHKYLRLMEDVIILTLKKYNIIAERVDGETGVWINSKTPYPEKICAMGIRASRWVTMHGLALNINTDLSYFDNIIPCGIRQKGITSMKKVLNKKISIKEVQSVIQFYFQKVFDAKLKTN
tara:strand:- start:2503 stop:3213 length:711 start_codon:yes stop_codon:yes gene_type:complete